MGHTTDFVGHIDISPPLNEAEAAYLTAFRHTRHSNHGGSPYDVRGNPFAPDDESLTYDQANGLGPGKPQLYCQWTVCSTGCCLVYDGVEKFYAPVQWMRWLIDHLLAPGAHGERSGHPMLAGFTFDHRLDGIVVGCRRDNRELFAIRVDDNVVTQDVMRRGDPDPWERAPYAYEEAIDGDRESLARRRRPAVAATAGKDADVVPLRPVRKR